MELSLVETFINLLSWELILGMSLWKYLIAKQLGVELKDLFNF
ncbi:MAG TPA: hypothetical protein PK079_00780 [Leptospiraceae bacterium]|nr:hypothetical protein [Leptospiraceae bacterium]HMX33592.1 hypothetical protein [Leptospiraceae bacterium]HMY29934.1 hypothetical protein [Leptospiraceae bacterium]HMZ67113.1 hypothetical protein [Leptospiraceae bacterium]HNA08250.1 hypothetical protein [Leptospiraceae bacterium]